MTGNTLNPWSTRVVARVAIALLAFGTLSACEEGQGFEGFQLFKPKAEEDGTDGGRSTRLVERDVEAPEVFQVTEAGLWDGRPSLGGVWVAHPDVQDPERVIIRNTSNGKFVIGALFRKERETPGPRLQVSSDAAAALGMLAGQPLNVNVTALRREQIAEAPEPDPAAAEGALDAPASVETATLDPVASTAAAAIDAATPTEAAPPAPKPSTPKPVSDLAKPYVQIGIFSVEKNAQNTAEAMRQAGMLPTVRKQSSQGKTFWRVLVGPATTKAELSDILKKIKATGFTDAYAVTN